MTKAAESKIKTQMAKWVRDRGGYARRFEDQYAVGTLDMVMIPQRVPPLFAEVKIVAHGKIMPTERQWVEMWRIDQTGAIAILIGYDPLIETFYFHEFGPRPLSVRTKDCFSVTTSEMHFYDQLVQFYHARIK